MTQFNRWLCPRCKLPGIDSWNKAMHDGLDFGGIYPPHYQFGHYCNTCNDGHPADLVVSYGGPEDVPRVILAGVANERPPDEVARSSQRAFSTFDKNPNAGIACIMSHVKDGDWSRGCLHVTPSPQTGEAPMNLPDSATKFWMVWRSNSPTTKHRHFDKKSAVVEAERLTKANPGEVFYVLKSSVAMVCKQPTIKRLKLEIDDLPF